MNSKTHSWLSILHLFFTIKFLLLFQSTNTSSSRELFYQTCGNTFTCGNTITDIRYPFRGTNDPPYCGHPDFSLACDTQRNVTTINIMNMTYHVLEIHQTEKIMRIVREDVVGGTCPMEMMNTTLDHSLFEFTDACTNLTFLYGCSFAMNFPGLVSTPCRDQGHSVYAMAGIQGPGICNASVVVPVLGNGGSANATELYQVLEQGFSIRWSVDGETCRKCTESEGRCGYDIETNRTTCFCPNPPYISGTCPVANGASPVNRTSRGMYD